jgi:hypothetical protein
MDTIMLEGSGGSGYAIERTKSNRSHCARTACPASKKNGLMIEKGVVRLKCVSDRNPDM